MNSPELLIDKQLEIVQQQSGARVLITAGAGTGKTLSLIHRLGFLIREDEVQADEILVLSFSRAAVMEIRNRLSAFGEGTQHIDVRTFDSYATQLLAEVINDESWQHFSYEKRIREATRLLREDKDAWRLAAEIRHLIVDEVQDLVGVRADLVRTLLERVNGGFTLLGDPAQGIYGFQLDDPQERIRGAAALYSSVRTTFADSLIELELTQKFRARQHQAEVALAFGPDLAREGADYASIQRDLRTELLGSMALGTLQDAIPAVKDLAQTTAILCRTNGQAFLISRELHKYGVAHRIQSSAQECILPAWISELFRRSDSHLSQTEATAIFEEYGLPIQETWPLLKRMDGNRRSKSLNLVDVRDRLIRGPFPDEFIHRLNSHLVVSTVHRVKGLEFDQVIVVDPGEPGDDTVAQAESARTLYVAMTRPRDLLLYIKPVDRLSNKLLKKFPNGRWAECGFGKFKHSRFSMEIRAEDVHAEDPAGAVGFAGAPREEQVYLSTEVLPGDPVSLIRGSTKDPGMAPSYFVVHKGRTIGVTSDGFSRALRQVVPGRDRHEWPESVEDLYVDSIETVVGNEAAGQNHGLGWSGVWLRPRIVGLGRFNWGSKERK